MSRLYYPSSINHSRNKLLCNTQFTEHTSHIRGHKAPAIDNSSKGLASLSLSIPITGSNRRDIAMETLDYSFGAHKFLYLNMQILISRYVVIYVCI